MDLKSYELFSKEHAASEKFDYYICSVAGALFAYIAQTYTPHKFDSWYYALMPVALLILAVCFCLGLRTIYLSKHVTTLNKEMLIRMEEHMYILDVLKDVTIQTFSSPKYPNKTRAELNVILESNRGDINALRDDATGFIKKADWLNVIRNVCLGIGFFLILAAKISEPYLIKK